MEFTIKTGSPAKLKTGLLVLGAFAGGKLSALTAAVDGAVYAKHGTTIDTRLTIIDKLPADDPGIFPVSLGIAPDVATLIGWIEAQVPPRLPVSLPKIVVSASATAPKTVRGSAAASSA